MISKSHRTWFKTATVMGCLLGFVSHPALAAKKPAAPDQKQQADRTFEQMKLLLDVYQQVVQNYVDDVDPQNLIYGAASGMINTLDPFSQFMVPEAREEMQTVTEGQFGGLGIRIMMKDSWLTVITPLPDTPAYRAGVLPEDRIVMIDDQPTQGMNLQDAVKKLRGAPKTQVKVTLAREGAKEPIPITLTRENIMITSIRARMLKDGVAQIRLTEFIEPTVRDLEAALKNMEKQGMKSLILDLRNDPGGLLTAAVDTCKEFIGDQKLIVYTEGRSQPRQEFRAGVTAPYKKLPMVVLINRGSASGSEIVAGAMQDLGRAVLIGTESFGKGSVQSVISLEDGSGLRLTTAKYYTPSGRSIHRDPKTGKGGIQPDIEVPVDRDTEVKLQAQSEEIFAKGQESHSAVAEKDRVKDVTLERAIEILRIRPILTGQKDG